MTHVMKCTPLTLGALHMDLEGGRVICKNAGMFQSRIAATLEVNSGRIKEVLKGHAHSGSREVTLLGYRRSACSNTAAGASLATAMAIMTGGEATLHSLDIEDPLCPNTQRVFFVLVTMTVATAPRGCFQFAPPSPASVALFALTM